MQTTPNVVILTTPTATQARKDNIQKQLEILTPHFNVTVQEDNLNSGTLNHIKALTYANSLGVIVFEDDAVIHEDFYSILTNKKTTPLTYLDKNSLYSFFTPKTRPQQYQQEIIKKVEQTKLYHFYELPTLVSGLGYYLPNPEYAKEMVKTAVRQKMLNERMVPHKNLTRNADFTIGKLFKHVSNNAPIMYFHPSLINHLNKGQESQVWLSDAHTTQDRSAHLYIGDIR